MKKISNVFWLIVIILVLGYFIGDRIPSLSKITQPSYNGTYTTTDGNTVLILDKQTAYSFLNTRNYMVMFKGFYSPEDSEIHWGEGHIKSHDDSENQYDLWFGLSQIRASGDEYLPIEISESGNKITASLYRLDIQCTYDELLNYSGSWEMKNLYAESIHDIVLRKLSDSTDSTYYEQGTFGDINDRSIDNFDDDNNINDDGYYWITEDESSDSESTDEESTPAAGGWDL
jgi:hypothetical protein